MKTRQLISLHGGHSGEFCTHAENSLEEIIQKYIRLGFKTVGISEHIPPPNDRFLYPDEKAADLLTRDLAIRFQQYFERVNFLKKKYTPEIKIFAGMETEAYTGYQNHIKELVAKFQPDYIVGSVRHINDIPFDYSQKEYDRCADACGSLDNLYHAYFDLQFEMIQALKPFMVGHFDLIRIYDKDYKTRLFQPEIRQKILRNLALIKKMGLVLDFNLRPLSRGEKDPYLMGSILEPAKEMGIRVVPGDDSHGVNEAGENVSWAVKILAAYGFDTQWPEPVLLTQA